MLYEKKMLYTLRSRASKVFWVQLYENSTRGLLSRILSILNERRCIRCRFNTQSIAFKSYSLWSNHDKPMRYCNFHRRVQYNADINRNYITCIKEMIMPIVHEPCLQSSPLYPAAQEQPMGSGPQINAPTQLPPLELQYNEPSAPHMLFPKPG